MPNHYNYRFGGRELRPAHRPEDLREGFNRRDEHHRREHFPWWLFPFLIDSKESKEYK